jgi:hypothetical protein
MKRNLFLRQCCKHDIWSLPQLALPTCEHSQRVCLDCPSIICDECDTAAHSKCVEKKHNVIDTTWSCSILHATYDDSVGIMSRHEQKSTKRLLTSFCDLYEILNVPSTQLFAMVVNSRCDTKLVDSHGRITDQQTAPGTLLAAGFDMTESCLIHCHEKAVMYFPKKFVDRPHLAMLENCDVFVFRTLEPFVPSTICMHAPVLMADYLRNIAHDKKEPSPLSFEPIFPEPLFIQLYNIYAASLTDGFRMRSSIECSRKFMNQAANMKAFTGPGIPDIERTTLLILIKQYFKKCVSNAKKRAARKRAKKKKKARAQIKKQQDKVSALASKMLLLKDNEEEEEEEDEEEDLCCVCLDASPTITFIICRHVVTCNKCAVSLQTCPVCRAKIVH